MAKAPALDDGERGPERTCVATRQVRPMGDLIRLVLAPDGMLVPDIRAKLPGRGVWVTAVRARVEEAARKSAFARSLKQPVRLPDDLPDLIDRLLAEDVRQSLAMANKAGLVITGFAKVEAAIGARTARAVLTATEGSQDGKRKLSQAIHRTYGQPDALPVISSLSGDEMDLALGRENAIHAALIAGPAGEAFLKRCERLDRYRQPDAVGPDQARSENGPSGPTSDQAGGD